MRRTFLVLALAAAPACAGQGSARTLPPGGGQPGTGPAGGGPGAPDAPAGAAENGAAAGDPGGPTTGAAAAGSGATSGVKPPGLDLPEDERAALVRGHLRKANGALARDPKDPDQAIHEAQAALAVDETSVPAMLVLAHANYVKDYYDKAEAVLEIAAKRPAGNSSAKLHFLYGLVYDKTDRPDEAQAAYERAVAIDGDYESALQNLGVHYLENKRYDDAIRLYERLVRDLGSQSPAAWSNLGSAYRGRSADFAGLDGDPAKRNDLLLKAKAAFKRALQIDSNFASAYYNLGVLYLDAQPFPGQGGDMDKLARLKRAKQLFDQYRRMPGADGDRADNQAKVAQDLIAREEKARAIRKRREERLKKLQNRNQGN
jgi:tetratricopeptide (TPR) repeat protein